VSQHNLITNQHSLIYSLTRKTTRFIIKRFTISIGLTIHTKDKAVGMAAADITSVKEAIVVITTIAVAIVTTAIIT
jgi:hypothetical protein